MHIDCPALLPAPVRAARAAGEATLEVYRTNFDAATKADPSHVTLADERAEATSLAWLEAAAPPSSSTRWMARRSSSDATGSSRCISRSSNRAGRAWAWL